MAWKLGYFELDQRRRLFETVQELRVVPGVAVWYFAASAILLAIGLPAAILSILGGAIFGFKLGTVLSWGSSVAGTLLAYELARTIAQKAVMRLFGHHKLVHQLRKHDDVLTLFRLRVIPAAPYAVLAYIAGVCGVSLRRLLIASALGIIPSALTYAYVGSAVMRGMVSVDDKSGRALWIAGAVTVAMIVVSLVAGRGRSSE